MVGVDEAKLETVSKTIQLINTPMVLGRFKKFYTVLDRNPLMVLHCSVIKMQDGSLQFQRVIMVLGGSKKFSMVLRANHILTVLGSSRR